MAERRMFTKKVTDSDDFISLPSSAQALYFHLNMGADDDGFNNQVQMAMYKSHSSIDDLKILLAKRFLLQFESGVIVIKHWRMSNALRKDRYNPTAFTKELEMLKLKENGSYSFALNEVVENERLPLGCQTVAAGKDRIGKDRIGKDRLGEGTGEPEQSSSSGCSEEQRIVIDTWNGMLSPKGISPIRTINRNTKRYKMLNARLHEYGVDKVVEAVRTASKCPFLLGRNDNGWSITFDWFVAPSNFVKVLEGNYLDNKTGRADRSVNSSTTNAIREWANMKNSGNVVEMGAYAE